MPKFHKPKLGERRARERFAWLPITCTDSNVTYWLMRVIVREIYTSVEDTRYVPAERFHWAVEQVLVSPKHIPFRKRVEDYGIVIVIVLALCFTVIGTVTTVVIASELYTRNSATFNSASPKSTMSNSATPTVNSASVPVQR